MIRKIVYQIFFVIIHQGAFPPDWDAKKESGFRQSVFQVSFNLVVNIPCKSTYQQKQEPTWKGVDSRHEQDRTVASGW